MPRIGYRTSAERDRVRSTEVADIILIAERAIKQRDDAIEALRGMLRVCPAERAGKRLPEYEAARAIVAKAKAGAA